MKPIVNDYANVKTVALCIFLIIISVSAMMFMRHQCESKGGVMLYGGECVKRESVIHSRWPL